MSAGSSGSDAPGIVGRFIMALVLPWKVLFDADFAGRVAALAESGPAALPAAEPNSPADVLPAAPEAMDVDDDSSTAPPSGQPNADQGAIQLLGLLQRDGRLVDFLLEDVSAYSDREIGGAARAVHEGCKKTVQHYFEVGPIRDEEEGTPITVESGFDPTSIRLVGNVSGEPPYTGTLAHPGWRVSEVRLPERTSTSEGAVLSPAEVEL